MIVECPACPARYSAPDAKIRGRKVRITCKHCGHGILVDGTEAVAVAAPALDAATLSALRSDSESELADDEATRIMPSLYQESSAHDEATVIGQVPSDILAAERLFAQRTEPPPPIPAASEAPASPRPEQAQSPIAEESAAVAPSASAPGAFVAPGPALQSEPAMPPFRAERPRRNRAWPWLLLLALAALAVALTRSR